jgi:hypothetical protein
MVRATMSMPGVSCHSMMSAATDLGMPVKPMATVVKAAPAMMKASMHDVSVACSKLVWKLFQLKVPVSAAKISAPSTPTAAASVAVAKPA